MCVLVVEAVSWPRSGTRRPRALPAVQRAPIHACSIIGHGVSLACPTSPLAPPPARPRAHPICAQVCPLRLGSMDGAQQGGSGGGGGLSGGEIAGVVIGCVAAAGLAVALAVVALKYRALRRDYEKLQGGPPLPLPPSSSAAGKGLDDGGGAGRGSFLQISLPAAAVAGARAA